MRKALFTSLIGACFVTGGGTAGASFIRYVAAPGVIMAEWTSGDSRIADAAAAAFAPEEKSDGEARSAEVPVCDAAFAAFMLQAVLGANGAGGEHLATLHVDAAKKMADPGR